MTFVPPLRMSLATVSNRKETVSQIAAENSAYWSVSRARPFILCCTSALLVGSLLGRYGFSSAENGHNARFSWSPNIASESCLMIVDMGPDGCPYWLLCGSWQRPFERKKAFSGVANFVALDSKK